MTMRAPCWWMCSRPRSARSSIKDMTNKAPLTRVELRGLEPLTPTLPGRHDRVRAGSLRFREAPELQFRTTAHFRGRQRTGPTATTTATTWPRQDHRFSRALAPVLGWDDERTTDRCTDGHRMHARFGHPGHVEVRAVRADRRSGPGRRRSLTRASLASRMAHTGRMTRHRTAGSVPGGTGPAVVDCNRIRPNGASVEPGVVDDRLIVDAPEGAVAGAPAGAHA